MLNDPDFIGDWYREKKLGSGGFGYVMLWKNKKSNESVAVKKCHIDAITLKQKERWDREVELMSEKINNENIVKAVKIKPDSFLIELNKYNPSGMSILIMEYCNGGDLRRHLNQTINCSGLIESEIRLILNSLRSAIFYLHSLKITHRDIKPENIVIKILDDGRKIYKLTDLGYAKPLDKHSIEASLVGTMEYLAPELLFTDKYSCSVDYWSLGIIAYEIITGVRPFIPHASLAQWMLHVQAKKSENIAIIEDNNGNKFYLNNLCKENFLSATLREYLEKWLKLALEWNAKQRGCVFKFNNDQLQNDNTTLLKSVPLTNNNNNNNGNTNIDNRPLDKLPPPGPQSTKGPIAQLQIFTMLDEILELKILTFFCLHTYTWLSYELTVPDTTMETIYNWLEVKCQISKEKIYLILSLDNEHCDNNIIDKTMNPEKLYIENYYDKPMVFITEIGKSMNCKNNYPIISKCIQNVLSEPKQQLKIHVLREFASNALFLVRNEQKQYMTCLIGFKNYTLQLNHEILSHKENITKMRKSMYGLNGQINLYNLLLEKSKEKLEKDYPEIISQTYPLWKEQLLKFIKNIDAITGACEIIIKRYESIVRRSKEIINIKLLENIHQDFYDTTHFVNAVDSIRAQILNKNMKEMPHKELFTRVYSCLKQRDKYLMDKEYLDLQRTMNDIHIEFEEILKAKEKALVQMEKYQREFIKINFDHQENIWTILQSQKKELLSLSPSYLPNIDIFNDYMKNNKQTNQLKNINNVDDSNKLNTTAIKFHIGKVVSDELHTKYGSSILCFGDGDNAKSLIDDNEKLRISMEGLMKDVNEEIITASAAATQSIASFNK